MARQQRSVSAKISNFQLGRWVEDKERVISMIAGLWKQESGKGATTYFTMIPSRALPATEWLQHSRQVRKIGICAGPNKHMTRTIHSLHLLGTYSLCRQRVSPLRWMLLLVQIFFISSLWKLAGWEKFSLSQFMKCPEIRSLRQSIVIM